MSSRSSVAECVGCPVPILHLFNQAVHDTDSASPAAQYHTEIKLARSLLASEEISEEDKNKQRKRLYDAQASLAIIAERDHAFEGLTEVPHEELASHCPKEPIVAETEDGGYMRLCRSNALNEAQRYAAALII